MIFKYSAAFIFLSTLTAALEASPDATCSGVQQYTCAGTENPCCSQYGWCGSSDDHCGVGCQSGFGACNETSAFLSSPSATPSTFYTSTVPLGTADPSAATPLTPPTNATLSVAGTSITSTALKPSASSVAQSNAQSCTCSKDVTMNPSCPNDDGACYTINGKTYSISCGGLANGEILGYPPIISLSTCISTCSMIPNCVAVSYLQQGKPECALLSKYSGPSSDSESGIKAVARLQGASCT